MSISTDQMITWCKHLVSGRESAPNLELADYLAAIPRLETMADLPAGTPVAVRGDVDAKPGANIGDGDIRLRSMVQTLSFGRERGWKQVVFGHIGRKPEGTLEKVAARLGTLLDADVPLISDWLDEKTMTISHDAAQQIADAAPGSVLVLENTRRYDIERSLWKATAEQVPAVAEDLAKFANEFADKIARHYVHEAFSAGSLDASSVVVPAAMQRVAMGLYEAGEFDGPMRKCLATHLVVFSGLKIDKLDDLEGEASPARSSCKR